MLVIFGQRAKAAAIGASPGGLRKG